MLRFAKLTTTRKAKTKMMSRLSALSFLLLCQINDNVQSQNQYDEQAFCFGL